MNDKLQKIKHEFATLVSDRAYRDFLDTYDGFSNHCESPIEKMLLAAIIYAFQYDCTGHNFNIFWRPNYKLILNTSQTHADESVHLCTQAIIGKYRVDFLFTVDSRNGTEALVVECDGHDFHEKTKEQAVRDKRRDRWMTDKGITVLRFTGSEIFKDPTNCAYEIEGLVCRLYGMFEDENEDFNEE